jgi:hypothetical protein
MPIEIPKLVRTPEQLRAARGALRLSAGGLANMVRVEDGRTVRRWEAGEREIPGPVTVLLETAMDFLRQIEEINPQLKRLTSGEMLSSSSVGQLQWGDGMVDTTQENIQRLQAAKTSLEMALATLTRLPPNADPSQRVHWYALQRATPLFHPNVKDDWTVPGELNPEAALAYFEKYEGFEDGLQLVDDDAPLTEFILEQRQLIRMDFGTRQQLRAGELITTFGVRRV